MNVFFCQSCDARLFFENTHCLSCGSVLGFLPDRLTLAALTPEGGAWRPTGVDTGGRVYQQCRNYEAENVCNWMSAADTGSAFCVACELNRTVPDLGVAGHRALWSKMETAKRRLVYGLLRLGLPVAPKARDPQNGLAFDFLADPDPRQGAGRPVVTGHKEGVVTINLAEADDAAREKLRLEMGEVYRTLLGHFRHEIGHYYWDVFAGCSQRLEQARQLFGDERADYGEALKAHYAQGPQPGWHERFVTPYAAAHPWEDWAESWAHYMHIMDTLETAVAHGVEIRGGSQPRRLENPFGGDFKIALEHWHALRIVLNGLNRSMGMPDAYPFVLSEAVAAKLTFIHDWVAGR